MIFSPTLKPLLVLVQLLVSLAVFGQSWGSVGTGTDSPVRSLTSFGEGLSVGGDFKLINNFNRVNHCLIRENFLDNYTYFFTFSEDFNTPQSGGNLLGTSINTSIAFNNKLHVGGKFYHESSPDNIGIGYIEKNEASGLTSFHSYSHQLADSQSVQCFKAFNGKLFFGGSFTGLNNANFIAYIESGDYPTPSVHAAGSTINGTVRSLEVFDNTLYAGGDFLVLDSDSVVLSHVAKWNGSDWEKVGNGLNSTVFSLFSFDDTLYAGGAFTASDSLSISKLARWDGLQWTQAGAGFVDSTDTVFSITNYDDTLYIGGKLSNPSYNHLNNIVMLVNNDWKVFAIGPSGPIYAMEAYRGKLYIGGDFNKVNTKAYSNLLTYHNGNTSLNMNDVVSNDVIVRVFPNPSNDIIRIESNRELSELRILSMDGRTLNQRKVMGRKSEINSSDLPEGIYQLEMGLTSGCQIFKSIIIHH